MSETAAELRRAFDRSFTEGQNADSTAVEHFLAIQVGSGSYVVRLTDVSGLFADKKITWLPSPVRELLGLVGLRGAVLPVYDLAMLFGLPRAVEARWLVVVAAMPIGLAFDGFCGYLDARPGDIVLDVPDAARRRHVREILRAEVARPIIHLPSILEAIGSRGGHDGRP